MDITLYYQEKGTGVPFIFLHGNGEDSTYFKHQIDHFSKEYRVIAIDTRGHGQSPRGVAPFTIEQFADDLSAFMDRLAIQSAIILGFSDGANIAMRFAIKYPAKVEALILNAGNLNVKGLKFSVRLPIECEYYLTKWVAPFSKKAHRKMELLNLMMNDPNITTKELKQIKVPTFIIEGSHDMIKPSHSAEIAWSISHSGLISIKGDHFIANKQPEAFNREVESFLEYVKLVNGC